jgi:hypothetical protein
VKLPILSLKLLMNSTLLSNKRQSDLLFRSLATLTLFLSLLLILKVERQPQPQLSLSTRWTLFKAQSKMKSWDNKPQNQKIWLTPETSWCTIFTHVHRVTVTKRLTNSWSTKFNTEWMKSPSSWACSLTIRATNWLASQLISIV